MKGICLKSWQVKALQDGRLKELIVPIKQQPIDILPMNGDLRGIKWIALAQKNPPKGFTFCCRFGKPGDRLFVKEKWFPSCDEDTLIPTGEIIYAAGYDYSKGYPYVSDEDGGIKRNKDGCDASPWKSAMHMQQKDSRFTLEIEDVKVLQVQDVDNAKQAELLGFREDERLDYYTDGTPSRSLTVWSPLDLMKEQWDKDHKPPFQWAGNPWCWNLKVKIV